MSAIIEVEPTLEVRVEQAIEEHTRTASALREQSLDEAVPRRRAELDATAHRHEGRASDLHRRLMLHRKAQPLIQPVEDLQRRMLSVRAFLSNARAAAPERHPERALTKRAVEAAIQELHAGWGAAPSGWILHAAESCGVARTEIRPLKQIEADLKARRQQLAEIERGLTSALSAAEVA
jgi:hypothetical protein